MKFTIQGFSQEKALEFRKEVEKKGKKTIIKLDCTDLLLLRWFVDFYPRMSKLYIEGKEYAWVNYAAIINDLPLLEMEKDTVYRRFKKMEDFKILEHRHIKDNGSYSYFGFGVNYELLIDTEGRELKPRGTEKNPEGGAEKNPEGVRKKIPNKDSSIKYNSSIIFNSNIYSDNFENEQKNSSLFSKELAQQKNSTTKPKEKQVKHKYGEYGWVQLTDKEYQNLINKYTEKRVNEAIKYIDESAESTGNKNGWKGWNLVIRRAIEGNWVRSNQQNKVPDKYSVNKDYSGGWD